MAIILNNIKTLVGGSGVSLPSLANPGTKEDLMLNKQLIDGNGNKVTGAMPNNGAISKTMDGLNTKSVSIPAGYTSGGTVSLTNDIDNIANTQASKITQIKTALEGKAAGGGGGGATLETCTVTFRNIGTNNFNVALTYILEGTGAYESVTTPISDRTFENVVKGSILLYDDSFMVGNTNWIVTGAAYPMRACEGAVAIFELMDDAVTIEFAG